ncbi:hypothetical protein ACFC3F_05080 [Microbacterium sp. NPDC055910]|uniref:hypothetical protein n=1 Tax=Microbacterium sp. NPDC055910 TaxID=3345659 RepID=UPI0035D9721D
MSITSTRPAPLMTRLNSEWTTQIAAKEYEFGSLGFHTAGALLEQIRTTKGAAQDALLYELVTLAHQGDRTAERVVLQSLIPAAQRMAHRVRSLDDFDRHDRVGYAIGAAWESIQKYKLHLHARVMANLTMNMLGILAPEKTANDRLIADKTAPMAADVLEIEAGAWQEPERTPEEQLANLFTWALDIKLVTTDELALLSRTALSDEKHADIASELGLSTACLRKRADRIRARIATAVQEGL